jgi:hypothetical protein
VQEQHRTYRVVDMEVAMTRAEDIFTHVAMRMGISPDQLPKVWVEFENGPELAEYTREEIQRLLDQMVMSCSEADILAKFGIGSEHRDQESPGWNNLFLMNAHGNNLEYDVDLNEITVLTLAANLHGMKMHGEEHCIIALRQEDLPENWHNGDSIDYTYMINHAAMVITHRTVYIIHKAQACLRHVLRFGNIQICEIDSRWIQNTLTFRSTRLRPMML